MPSALILCSGGIDSVVCAHYVKKKLKYNQVIILFFNYKQNSVNLERRCALRCAQDIGATFKEITVSNLDILSKTDLKKKEAIGDSLKDTRRESEQWYIPCRNIIFLSYSLALAEESNGKTHIFIGLKEEGNDFFPDASQEFIGAMDSVGQSGTYKKTRIKAPFIKLDKEDIIRKGLLLGVNFKHTVSCYRARKLSCGRCLACRLRKKGFYWAGIDDPTDYES